MSFDELFQEHNLTPEERHALVLHLAMLRAMRTVQALEKRVDQLDSRTVPLMRIGKATP